MTYADFLQSKIARAEVAGFASPSGPHSRLFGHQSEIARWMTAGGRRACFANFGLGKTAINLQVGKWVYEQTGGKYLIVAPLGVRQEFTQVDGPRFDCELEYVRNDAEALASDKSILITNYERVRDGDITPARFAGAGLDEASCLRSFGSKTYQEFLQRFKGVKYRHVFTATPSPNRYKELIHYAAFLGVMDSGEALTRFFQRDSEKAGNLTLMPHMEDLFRQWLASWAVFIQKPSDLGFSDEGYDLPPVKVHWHRIEENYASVKKNCDSWGQFILVPEQARGLTKAAEYKRDSIGLRVQAARAIIESEADEHWLVWHDLEAERAALEKTIPGLVTIFGSQELETREERVLAFSRGEIARFGTKPSLSGSGCNFQRHCARAVYLGVGYEFNDFIQAFHRIVRFQQGRECHVHILYLESEQPIRDELERKWRDHDRLMERMSELVRQHKLSNMELAA